MLRPLSPASLARLALLLLLGLPLLAHSQADETSRSWNQPVEPFRIIGNVYYVGANEITSYLITSPQGHVLLDSGFVETVPLIVRNVEKLGFRMKDVKVLINSHAHFDHAAGLARLKELTGAQLYASAPEAPILARGDKGDYRFGDELAFAPVKVDRIVEDGKPVQAAGITLVPHLTPGHTPGCTTWSLAVQEGDKKRDVVFVCSATVLPGVTLRKSPRYPKIADDFARTFRVLKSLPCDVFLGSHGSFFDLTEKSRRRARDEGSNPFIDPAGYRAYVERAEKAYRERLAAEPAPR